MIYKPHTYQEYSTEHIIRNPYSALFLEMGLGKTVSTLTAIDKLMFEDLDITKVLVIAPKQVAGHTWKEEIEKWDHLKHLRLSIVLGTERERKEALRAKADIYIINRENTAWLVSLYQSKFPFDMLVIDELSSFKNPESVRFKALRTVRPLIRRVVGLTGTPAPKGLEDLWAQIYLLDRGERLGETITGFRTRYFRKNPYKPFAKYEVIKEEDSLIGPGYYEKKIYDKISDICISMKARDYLDIPKRVDRIKWVHFPPEIQKKYDDFEESLILAMVDAEITAVNAGVLTNKLRQFANGAVYDTYKIWHEVHREKLEALEEDIQEANGKPVLVFYQYQSDLERILKHFKAYKPVLLRGPEQIKKWNEGKIQLMVTHAASAGHGLNLQYGGHLIEWFGLDWPLEPYEQGVARLDRQGQAFCVINSRILVKNTIDEDVLDSIINKQSVQDALMNAVKVRVAKVKRKLVA